jgi:hypothetical protein
MIIPVHDAVPGMINLTCLDRLVPCFASLTEALA